MLFMDIVAYSTLPMGRAAEGIRKLQDTTSTNSEFVGARNGDQLIRLPTGDGMALVFFGDPEAPVRCALTLARSLQQHPEIKLRMGLHSGPVYRLADINANRNVAGGGINVAQRVMDCGDAGHILVSKALADVLTQITGWKNTLSDLGDAEVKHGFRVHLFNLCAEGVGNPKRPRKLRTASVHRTAKWSGALVTVIALMFLAQVWLTHGSPDSVPLVFRHAFYGAQREVRSVLGIPDAPQERQLAVLPAPMPAADPESSALERGLAETLAARLTQLTGSHPLQVIPASEITAAGVTTLQQAQEEFGVTLGLELSLQRSGEMVRVNYSLVDAKTHRQIHGDRIDGQLSDTFAIEDQVTESVLRSLELDLQPEERRLLAARGTNEPSAYDYYLQGRGYLQEFQKPENVDNAITVFDRALELDPKYSLVFSGLGEAYWRKYELEKDAKWTRAAKDNCKKALSLDESQAQGHICLGLVDDGTGKYEEASKEFQTAVALEPTSDNAIRGLASAYEHLGRMDAAEKAYSAAIAARPNYWRNYNSLGALYMDEAHYAQAAEMFSRVIALAPDSFRGYSNLSGAYLSLGRYSDAITALQRSIAIRGSSDAYSNLATVYFDSRQFDDAAQNYKQAIALGDQDYGVWGNLGDAYYYSVKSRGEAAAAYAKAITLAKQSLEVNPRDTGVLSDISGYYSMLGDRPEAFAYLNRALQGSPGQDPNLFFQASLVNNQLGDTRAALQWLTRAIKGGYSIATVEQAPALDNLRSNSEFQALVHNANAGKQ